MTRFEDRPTWAFRILSHRSRHMCLPGRVDWFVNRPRREQEFVKANIGLNYWQDTGRMVQPFKCNVGRAA